MIFIGDLVCPADRVDALKRCIEKEAVFNNEIVVLNLEADILFTDDRKKPLTLWNSPRIIELFSKAKKVIVCIANNHAYDYPESILPTVEFLRGHGIGVFGLCDEDGGFSPYEYLDEGGIVHAFFGHCWRLYTKTNPNRINNVRIVDCSYSVYCDTIKKYKESHQGTKVYCMMHWNYDLEHLPFPMHRKVAQLLIDNGADAVVGSHSHCPQGAEFYKGKPVLYGMGNFYLPSGVYFNGTLQYPECSHITCGLQIIENQYRIVWFNSDGECPIQLISTETLGGEHITSISPFLSMAEREYVRFFKKNRLKKTLVPVFDEMNGLMAALKERWAIMRVAVLRSIMKKLNR